MTCTDFLAQLTDSGHGDLRPGEQLQPDLLVAQARAQLGVCHRVLGGKLGQLLQELLVLLGPVDRTGDTVGALPPQVSHAALEHMTAGTSARMA